MLLVVVAQSAAESTRCSSTARASGAVGSRLRQLGHGNVIEISFGADSPDPHYANMRAYMWEKMKDWLLTGSIDADARLECDLTGPGYVVDNKVRVRLESKEDMKKRGLAAYRRN